MLALPCTESTVTDSAVTHGAEGYKSLGSGFDSELTETENRTVRILLAGYHYRLLHGESEVVRSALEKLREQARQHGWMR